MITSGKNSEVVCDVTSGTHGRAPLKESWRCAGEIAILPHISVVTQEISAMNVHKNNMDIKKCHIRTDTTHEDDRERKEMRQKSTRRRTVNVCVNADWLYCLLQLWNIFYMLTLKLSYVKCHSTSFCDVQVLVFMRVLFMRHDAECCCMCLFAVAKLKKFGRRLRTSNLKCI